MWACVPYGDRGSSDTRGPTWEGNSGRPSRFARSRSAPGHAISGYIAGGYFVCGAARPNGLIGTHLIPKACVDHGGWRRGGRSRPELASTGVFALHLPLEECFRAGSAISDGTADCFCAATRGPRGLSLLYLPFAFDMSVYGLPLFSIVYGFLTGLPAQLRRCACLPPLSVPSRTGIMVAWIMVIHQLGSASAAYAGRRAADHVRHISRSLHHLGDLADRGGLDGPLCCSRPRPPAAAKACGDLADGIFSTGQFTGPGHMRDARLAVGEELWLFIGPA